MSKEMTVIALGIWILLVPHLGVPGSWRTTILIVTGLGVALVGFLLRGEAIARGFRPPESHTARRIEHTFVESPITQVSHEHKEGINSLN